MIILCRKTTVTAQELPGGDLLVHGQFEDENHLFDAQLTVNRQTAAVTSAYAAMARTPYGEVCRGPLANVSKLTGFAIGPGSSRRVATALGGPTGCTHLVDLVVEIFRAYMPAMARIEEMRLTEAYRSQGVPSGELRGRVFQDIQSLGCQLLPDTCAAYHRGSGNDLPA
ncbi:MAG TPA: DUF2889 domain-containing protein [Bacillota bacterium]|jgi:hypothetical protein